MIKEYNRITGYDIEADFEKGLQQYASKIVAQRSKKSTLIMTKLHRECMQLRTEKEKTCK